MNRNRSKSVHRAAVLYAAATIGLSVAGGALVADLASATPSTPTKSERVDPYGKGAAPKRTFLERVREKRAVRVVGLR